MLAQEKYEIYEYFRNFFVPSAQYLALYNRENATL